jgi:hypothetical protein
MIPLYDVAGLNDYADNSQTLPSSVTLPLKKHGPKKIIFLLMIPNICCSCALHGLPEFRTLPMRPVLVKA